MAKLNKDECNEVWGLNMTDFNSDVPVIVTYDEQDRIIFLDFNNLRKKSITK